MGFMIFKLYKNKRYPFTIIDLAVKVEGVDLFRDPLSHIYKESSGVLDCKKEASVFEINSR